MCETREMEEGKYVSSVDVNKVNELLDRVSDIYQLKFVLIDPALKLFLQFSGSKYIKKSNNANMKEYDKKCFIARKGGVHVTY